MFRRHRPAILREIARSGLEHRRAPSIRELADVCDVSVSTMHDYLAQLVELGEIDWSPRSHRAMRLTHLGREAAEGDL